MKKLFFVLMAAAFSLAVSAQGNSGNKGKSKSNPSVSNSDVPGNSGGQGNTDKSKDKSKEKDKDKEKEDKTKSDDHDRKVWDGVEGGSGCGKVSKNQPAKVRSNFTRDYPNAINVRWTKCRGDWTARFGNGLFLSTAVYHANGDRKDTRTPVSQENIPRRVLDEIFKKRPADTRIDDAVKIEVPNVVKDIFRIKNILEGKTNYQYLDSDGNTVEYNY